MEPPIGLVSDTHGLVRPEALDALRGCGAILHAGDVGGADVLAAFAALAPLFAVRGNNDEGPWAEDLPGSRVVRVGAHALFLVHDPRDAPGDGRARGLDAVVTGHTHRPSVDEVDGVLLVNPGSAGPRRFRLPVTVARLWPRDGRLEPELVEIVPRSAR